MPTIRCDVLIVGASLGGVAAAIRAGEMGADVVVLEEGQWIGGQLTSQGVCTPDENRWIEISGGTRAYQSLRQEIRDHYQNNYRLTSTAAAQEHLNIGNCWVSRISAEPRVIQQLLRDKIASLSGVKLHLGAKVIEAEQRINEIPHVVVRLQNGDELQITPRFILDATELGDFLPLAGIEHRIGAESYIETGEPDAPNVTRPDWIQPMTVPFGLELCPKGENHTIPRPVNNDQLKTEQNYHIVDGAMRGMFGELGWWTYRRLIDASNFDDPAFPNDIAMINTGSNDYKGGVIPTIDPISDAETIARARDASLGYIFWLQTECPRIDEPGQFGYPEFRLKSDLFEDISTDGLAPAPYIRESRRIKSRRTILEQDVVIKDGKGTIHQSGIRAAQMPDSCGIGHYWLDIHEGGTDEPNRFFETAPFQIPLGSLIPIRVKNVLASCKNLGVTHLTNGCYRLHPIEWNIGEAAGALAAFSVQNSVYPTDVLETPQLLRNFQRTLVDHGIPITWYGDLPPAHPSWKPAQLLGAWGIWPLGENIDFMPDAMLAEKDRFGELSQLPREITRSEAINIMWEKYELGEITI